MVSLHHPDRENSRVLDMLSSQLDALSEHVSEQATSRRGERNRMALLYVHAWFALLTAPLFLVWATGPAGMKGVTWQLIDHLPGVRWGLPALLFAGGVVLALATAARSPRAAGIGLLLVCVWYAIIALSFAGTVIVWLSEGAPESRWPAVYAPFVYGHLCVILLVHLRTVWLAVRSLRAGSQR